MREESRNAVILVDYPNVRRITGELIGDPGRAGDIVHRLVDELKGYTERNLGFSVVRAIAISAVSHSDSSPPVLQQSVLSEGVEVRFVYSAEKEQASAVELTLAASEIVHSTADISAYLILTGDRWYVPLAQHLKRHGRSVLVASLEIPTAADQVPSNLVDHFMDARGLLQRAGRFETSNGSSTPLPTVEIANDEQLESGVPAEALQIEDQIAHQAMEIIEQYFGQYKEVYLTPLLRKLTELLEEEDEPKTVINYLEECGAVWLEKRRGFPHNYTVLLVNYDHPDVMEIREALQNETSLENRGAFDEESDLLVEDDSRLQDAHDL